MGVSWYDVLGVASDASTDEIRAAWRDATADLEPTDRRFDLYNQAAKVLLDADSRARYDAEEGAADGEGSDSAAATGTGKPGAATDIDSSAAAADADADADATDGADSERAESERAGVEEADDASDAGGPSAVGKATDEPESRGGVPAWLIGALALAVLVVAGLASYVTWFAGDDQPAGEGAVREAQSVLDNNFGDILTYHWDDLEAAHQRASALLTPRYQCEFDQVWALVAEQAAPVEAVVETEVLRSGVVRVSEDADRVEFVALIRNTAVNKSGDQGVGTLLVGVTMVERDGDWLVDVVDGLATGTPQDADPCAPQEPSEDAS